METPPHDRQGGDEIDPPTLPARPPAAPPRRPRPASAASTADRVPIAVDDAPAAPVGVLQRRLPLVLGAALLAVALVALGATAFQMLRPRGPLLADVTLVPDPVVGGQPVRGTVVLSRPAPREGAALALDSQARGEAATVTANTLAVTAGRDRAVFEITTRPVSVATAATVRVALDGTTVERTLTVLPSPLALERLEVSPRTVTAGQGARGTVFLDGAAPSFGARVTLTSSDPTVRVPARVMVQPGQRAATFPVSTDAERSVATATVTAAWNNDTADADLSVRPAVRALVLDPARTRAGGRVNGVVTLTGPAPEGGAEVTLESADAARARPERRMVTVPAGRDAASFSVVTPSDAPAGGVEIRARHNNTRRAATLTVESRAAVAVIPLTVTSVRVLQPAPLGPDDTGTAVHTFSGDAAPGEPLPVGTEPLALEVTFSRAVDPASATDQTFFVEEAGLSSQARLGGATVAVLADRKTVRWRFPRPLTEGVYAVTVKGTGAPAVAAANDGARLATGDLRFTLNVSAGNR